MVFYVCSGAANAIFIVITALSTFFGAILAENMSLKLKALKTQVSREDFKAAKERTKSKKRAVLLSVLLTNAGVLAVLKYAPPIARVFGKNVHGWLLPLGISFYTFQSIGYFMDVYNGKYKHERSFLKYLTFISFFPQLIQGPINRYDKLGAQLQEGRRFDFENIKKGFMLFLFGAMKKYCIADMLSPRVAAVLDGKYSALPGGIIAMGVLFYSIYQYADFSGGIDMAVGAAKMFGIDMMQNFRQPYFATSIADFWRRWHITLGLWMKDYVFYPLALTKWMQRVGKWCASHWGKHAARFVPAGIANIIVFLLVGIWHGGELHYVLWGLYNGLIIAISDALKPSFETLSCALRINTKGRAFHAFRILRTFTLVNIGWYFDRIANVKQSFTYLARTFTAFGSPRMFLSKHYLKSVFGNLSDAPSQAVLIFWGCLITFTISILREGGCDVYAAIQCKGVVFRWASYYVLMILIILSFSFSPGNPVFMYAQF